jgi:starch synthase
MKVLLAASEVAPIIKIGGLGDVTGSLPKALEKLGVNIDVIAPFFPSAKTENLDIYKAIDLNVPFNGENVPVEVFKTKLPGSNVDVILLKNAQYFSTGGTNFFAQNITETEMFVFFDRAVVEYIKSGFNMYDLIHCNDWHTGLITHLLEDEIPDSRPATLFTIHNLMYQGIGGADIVREVGLVPGTHAILDWDIADGDMNMMQQGVAASDFINAVSPTYAKEVLTGEFGGELADVLKAREGRLSGILNGLDYSAFPRDYAVNNWETGKRINKEKLFAQLGLKGNINQPLFSYIGRIDPNQKGIDLILDVIPEIIEKGGLFLLLGTGVKEWEEKLNNLAKDPKLAGKFICITKFDMNLANLMYSGSDFLVVPSKYEPCGLIQMIAVWYGTLPIVRGVGGLKDSITDKKNGFTFEKYCREDFMEAINKAFEIFNNKNKMDEMVVNAMKGDFSWNKSAKEYFDLYTKVIEERKSAREPIHI